MRKTVLLLTLVLIQAAVAWPDDDAFAKLSVGQRVKVTLKSRSSITGEVCSIKKDSVTIDNSLEQGFTSKLTIPKQNITGIEILTNLSNEQKNAIIEKRREESRKQTEELITEGRKELDDNNYAMARKSFEKALMLDPVNSDARSGIAEACFRIAKNKYDEYVADKSKSHLPDIITASREAAKYDPSKDEYFQLLGTAHYENENYYDAVEALEKSYRLNPENAGTLSYLSASLYWLDELADAEKYAEEALKIRPDYAFIQKLLGTIRKEKAIAESYTELSSSIFKIKFKGETGGDTAAANDILAILQEDYNNLSARFNVRFSSPVKVILYPDTEYYSQTGTAGFYAAHYEPGKQKIHVPMKNFSENRPVFENALNHELAHSFIHNIAPDVPRWIDEGIAQYYTQEENKDLLNVVKYSVAKSLSDSSFIHIRDFTPDFWENARDNRDIAEQFYAESLSFMQFLADGFHDTSLITLLKNIEKTGNTDDALFETFRAGLDELEKQWTDSLLKQ